MEPTRAVTAALTVGFFVAEQAQPHRHQNVIRVARLGPCGRVNPLSVLRLICVPGQHSAASGIGTARVN